MVEHLVANEKAVGSIPITRSKLGTDMLDKATKLRELGALHDGWAPRTEFQKEARARYLSGTSYLDQMVEVEEDHCGVAQR